MSKVREYIDFWVENSFHAAEQYSTPGATCTISCAASSRGQAVKVSLSHDQRSWRPNEIHKRQAFRR